MTSDPFGYDLPPSTARIPRIVPGVDRVSLYRLVASRVPPLDEPLPSWVRPGELLDGFESRQDGLPGELVVLLEPGGEGRCPVPAGWVQQVAG